MELIVSRLASARFVRILEKLDPVSGSGFFSARFHSGITIPDFSHSRSFTSAAPSLTSAAVRQMSPTLSPIKHILFAILCFLIPAGNHALLPIPATVAATDSNHPPEFSAPETPAYALQAISPDKLSSALRPPDGRLLTKIPLSVWNDSPPRPLHFSDRFQLAEIPAQNPRLLVAATFARAPPARL